jgi:hypothetical protein
MKTRSGAAQSKERDLQVTSPSAAGQVLEYRKRFGSLTLQRRERRAPSRILANMIDIGVLQYRRRNGSPLRVSSCPWWIIDSAFPANMNPIGDWQQHRLDPGILREFVVQRIDRASIGLVD